MNLVNNRYRVEKVLKKGKFDEYFVRDSFDNNVKFMRIFDREKDEEIIEFYTREFIWLRSIKHKRILNTESFGIIETINLKPNKLPLYFMISEIQPKTSLDSIYKSTNLNERIKIIQQLISAVDYMHFRGFIYKYLDPTKIYYSKEEGIKLLNLTYAIEFEFVKSLEGIKEDFIAPSVLINNLENNVNCDYFSLAVIMRYLLMADYSDENSFIFSEYLDISSENKELLKGIIRNLHRSYTEDENVDLKDIINKLSGITKEEFLIDYKEEREHLYFNSKIVGREKELKFIENIDYKILNNTLDCNGLMIRGSAGVGKSRLFKEIIFRFRMKGRTVFKFNINQTLTLDFDIIRIFMNIITYNIDKNILERYRENFKDVIPEKYGYDEFMVREGAMEKVEQYQLFNSICNYLKELSLLKPVYIVIENIGNYNDLFLNLIDYLMQSIFNSRIYIIFTCSDFIEQESVSNKIQTWADNHIIETMDLMNLSEKNVGLLVRNILGISYVPLKFSSVLYKYSKGNPRFLDLSIKEIYNTEELYIAEDGKWHSEKSNYEDLSLPTDFREAIIKQTKIITGDKLEIIKLISISSESMPKFLIYIMLDFDFKYLTSLINSLLNEQILVENSYDINFFYRFLSNELKTTVYHDIEEKEKKALHSDMAKLLMEYKPNEIKNLEEEIVYHLIRSGDKSKAIDVAVAESSKYGNIYMDKSINLLELAFSIVKDMNHEKKLEILEKLTTIYFHKSDLEKMEVYLKEFTKEAEKVDDLEYIIRAKSYYAELYIRNNEMDKLKDSINEISELSLENDYIEGIILSYILNISLLIKDPSADKDYIREMLNKALEISKKYGISKYLGKIYLRFGLFADINGDFEEAIKYYEKSIRHKEQKGNFYEIIKAINNLGNVFIEYKRDYKKCFEYFNQALALTSKYGFTYLEGIILYNMGEVYLHIFDYENAKEYTEKSLLLAEENQDIHMSIISSCNLGRIDLLTNEFDKAYRVFEQVKDCKVTEEITNREVINVYRNFLGEFYFKFGEYDLAISNSQLALDASVDFNEIEYLKAYFRLIHIDYLKGRLDRNDIRTLLDEIARYKSDDIYKWNILKIVISLLRNGEYNFAQEIMEDYYETKEENEDNLKTRLAHILKLFLADDLNKLAQIEEKFHEMVSYKNYSVDIDLYILLATKYQENKNYTKAMRYFMKAYDGIYKETYTIDEFDFKLSFIKNYNVQKIKDDINHILLNIYGIQVPSIDIKDIKQDNFEEYFDTTPLIDSLTNKEINDMVAYREDSGINSVGQLISSFSTNYMKNIKSILKYLGKETLAQRGFVFIYSRDKIRLEGLVSLIDDDSISPNEMILLQSLRQEDGFLYNFNSPTLSQKKYFAYLPNKSRGLICIPILSDKTFTSIDMGNSYIMNENNVYGYIYLETEDVLNRFDVERLKLANSLTKLVALNLENENLKTNSIMDRFTNVYTKKYFDFQLEKILEIYRKQRGSLTVLMLDIDRFKNINDKYGHSKGDEVLHLVAENIRNTVGYNGIVGRYGGEEFIVLLWDLNLDDAIILGEKIRINVENMNISEIEDSVTISIGLAQFPQHGNYKVELINNADQALYYAKELLLRNSIAVWNRNIDTDRKSFDKTKGLVTGSTTESNRNILQIVEIAENLKENKDIKEKIYHLLSAIITVTNCEYASFILYDDVKKPVFYTRKREVSELVEENNIQLRLVNRVYKSRKGIFTIDWEDDFKYDFNLPNWNSVMVVPVVKNEDIKGIIYLSVALKEKEFNQDILNIVNIFSNIFSGNF